MSTLIARVEDPEGRKRRRHCPDVEHPVVRAHLGRRVHPDERPRARVRADDTRCATGDRLAHAHPRAATCCRGIEGGWSKPPLRKPEPHRPVIRVPVRAQSAAGVNVASQDKHHIAGMPRYRGNGVGHRPVAVRARLIDQDHTHVAACAPEPPNLPQQSEHRRAPSTILLRLPPDASLAQRGCVAACQEGIDPSLVRHWMLERQPHSHASPSNRASDSPDKRRDLGRAMDLTQQDQRSVLDRVTDRIDGRAALQRQLPRDRRLACALARRPAPRDDEGRGDDNGPTHARGRVYRLAQAAPRSSTSDRSGEPSL